MRYYEQKYPEMGELVMVQVRQITETGAYVELLEYDNMEGLMHLSKPSSRRVRSVQGQILVGGNEVAVVLHVDKEKAYVDLSNLHVSPQDIVECQERYKKSKAVESIFRHVTARLPPLDGGGELVAPAESSPQTQKSEEVARTATPQAREDDGVEVEVPTGHGYAKGGRLEKLYETVAWPLGKKYGHPYDAFKFSLPCDRPPNLVGEILCNIHGRCSGVGDVWSSLPAPIPAATFFLLTGIIKHHLALQPIKLRANTKPPAYTSRGMNAIWGPPRPGPSP